MTKKPGFFVYGVDPVLLVLSAEYAKEERKKQRKRMRSKKAINRKTSKGVSKMNQDAQ